MEINVGSNIAENAKALASELDWLAAVVQGRLAGYGNHESHWQLPEAPSLDGSRSAYADLVRQGDLSTDERLVLILCLAPHLRPQILDPLFGINHNVERHFTEFGGVMGKNHRGFLPTCETAIFLLAGSDLEKRFEAIRYFQKDHFFARQSVLRVDAESAQETLFSGGLRLVPETLHWLTTGVRHKPDFSSRFPAKLISTQLSWEDLVLAPEVREEISNLQTWLDRGANAMHEWGLEKHIKPGYRALFYGPAGTGKTLTTTLIGATVCMDVYRVDLSMLVSKYSEDTEKNLAAIFDQAANKNWILFFDDTEALFGRRPQGNSSNQRHTHHEAAYLLQRIEDFPGVLILACNLRGNIDEAFARHFQCTVHFPMPDAEQRLALWYGIFGPLPRLAPDVDLRIIAENYVLSGGSIANVARYAVLRALNRQRKQVMQEDLLAGIGRELAKEGKAAS